MSLEPKPRARKPSPQLRFVLAPQSRAYLRAVAKRTGLPERQVVDQLIAEAMKLQRAVEALGYDHVGEALAVLRELKDRR